MRRPPRHRVAQVAIALLGGLVVFSAVGCAATPYRYGGQLHTERDAAIGNDELQMQRGRPTPLVDAVGWAVGIPAKIIMLDHRVNNHFISRETEVKLQEYLAANNLDRVKVRINQYDPIGEWHRLTDNKSVGWPVRYTAGTLTVVGYTLLPGRVFGGDRYNPFTNTISVYSDVPAIALYQGGRAKDYAQREYKGLYAVAYAVPGVGMFCHDAHASNDAMSYLQETGTPAEIRAGYRSVCPIYAVDATDPIAAVTGVPLVLPAIVAGHVVGQCKAASFHDNVLPEEELVEDSTENGP